MPGRGASWRGKGQGVKDRIGTDDIADDEITGADIKDLTIEEVDLSAAVTAKLNAGGGHVIQDEGTPLVARGNLNFVGAGVTASDGIEDTTTVTIAGGGGGGAWEQIGKTILLADATTASVSFPTENLDGTIAQLKLIAILRLNATDTLNIRFDNRADGSYALEGSHSSGGTHTALVTNDNDGITSGKLIDEDANTMIELDIAGHRNISAGNNEAHYFYKEHEAGIGVVYAGGQFQTISITGISSFDIRTKNQIVKILKDSYFIVYRLNIA